MLIFIENTPRAYAWGSRHALPELLGTAPNGEPQAELWLGAHPGDPATVAKATAQHCTLIELIERDPERYGVDGGQLPFLLKVLAIGAPLSLQVHPDSDQARAGFLAEEELGLPRDAFERNYRDDTHKPELLVALTEVQALAGFRPLAEARREWSALVELAPPGAARAALAAGHELLTASGDPGDEVRARRALLCWALGGDSEPREAVRALRRIVAAECDRPEAVSVSRWESLRTICGHHADDPGALVSILLHLVELAPGEAIYLAARQLHAYLSGVAVEVMAASDNVLRAGLTGKHVDVDELLKVVDASELASPRFAPRTLADGVQCWAPDIPDFQLMRVRLSDAGVFAEPEEPGSSWGRSADSVSTESAEVATEFPLVLIVTEGRVRVERPSADFDEVASVARGQSLYISAGEPILLTGVGEVFLATVGEAHSG